MKFLAQETVVKGETRLCFSHELLHAAHIKSSLGGRHRNNSPQLLSRITNADEAVMILTIPKSLPQIHRSLLNHTGFTAQANPLCSDHRERHQRSGTNTLVWGAFRPLLPRPRGLEAAQKGGGGGAASGSLWLRNTPLAPALARCRPWTVAPGLPGPR